jgi:hypothetical protein
MWKDDRRNIGVDKYVDYGIGYVVYPQRDGSVTFV